MKKNLIIFLLILILLLTLLIFLQRKTFLKKGILFESGEKEISPSARATRYTTGYGSDSGKVEPLFGREIIVDPRNVREGEKQTISIWVKDEKGVSEVSLKIWTEKEEKEIKFSLVEGNNKEGRWQGSWQTDDILPGKHYKILFRAKNLEGKENLFSFFIETEK